MMLAATMAGVGFGSAGVHIPHSCAYPIASLKHEYQPPGYPDDHPFVPHGHSVIVTAPAAFRFTYDAMPERHHQPGWSPDTAAGHPATPDVHGCRRAWTGTTRRRGTPRRAPSRRLPRVRESASCRDRRSPASPAGTG